MPSGSTKFWNLMEIGGAETLEEFSALRSDVSPRYTFLIAETAAIILAETG